MLTCAPQEVEAELRLRGETLLFKEPDYLPMHATMIDAAVQAALLLKPALARHELSDQRVMVSEGTRRAERVGGHGG